MAEEQNDSILKHFAVLEEDTSGPGKLFKSFHHSKSTLHAQAVSGFQTGPAADAPSAAEPITHHSSYLHLSVAPGQTGLEPRKVLRSSWEPTAPENITCGYKMTSMGITFFPSNRTKREKEILLLVHNTAFMIYYQKMSLI